MKKVFVYIMWCSNITSFSNLLNYYVDREILIQLSYCKKKKLVEMTRFIIISCYCNKHALMKV